MLKMFFNCTSLEEIDLSGFNTKNVESMDSMFTRCTSLQNLNISNFDMSNVTTKDGMFSEIGNNTDIITNAKMKEWMATNYPNLTNVHE